MPSCSLKWSKMKIELTEFAGLMPKHIYPWASNNGVGQIVIQSQLNVKSLEEALNGYWDRQHLELIKFGFSFGL